MENLFDNVEFDSQEDSQEIEINTEGEGIEINTDGPEGTEESAEPAATKETNEEEEGTIDLTEFLNNSDNSDTEIDEPSSTESSSSPYNTFALALSEEGLISLNEKDKVESFDDLAKLIARTIKENEFKDLSEQQRTYLESIRNGIPEETVLSSLKTLDSFNKITEDSLEENEDLRLNLITQDFLAKGFEKSKAEKLAKRSVELGEDLEDSKEALNNLKTLEADKIKNLNAQKAEEAKNFEKEYQANLSKIKDTILKTDVIVPGLPLNDRVKTEVFDNMTKVVAYDEYGNPLNALGAALQKDREGLEIKLNYLFTVTKGFSDFSSLKATTKSNVLKELEDKLATTQLGSGKTKSSGVSSTTLKGTLAAIDTLNL